LTTLFNQLYKIHMIRFLEYLIMAILGIVLLIVFPIIFEIDDLQTADKKMTLQLIYYYLPVMICVITIRVLILFDKDISDGYKELSNLGIIALVILPILLYFYSLI
jgi:hypothetical protein